MSDYTTRVTSEKEQAVSYLKEKFGEASDFIFADYRGLTVEQITELRGKLYENDAEFRVVKNRYAKIAFNQLGAPDVSGYLVGPTAVAVSKGDSNAVAKEMFALAKDWSMSVKGGLVGGTVYDASQVEAFSKLPGRLELLSMLMSTMKAPVRNLTCALNDVPTRLVRVLKAVADKKAAE
jgi:large subunit ribosomal protein L10